MIGHPGDVRLNRFADGELAGRARARVSAHLAKCSRCRNKVADIRRLSREAGELAPLPAPADLKERLMIRVRAGEQVILPVADPAPPRPARRWAAAAGVAAAVVVIAAVSFTPRLASESSELRFVPDMPQAGAQVEVEYRSTGLFAGEDQLVLRARFRRPDDLLQNSALEQIIAAPLLREAGGRFVGVVHLPPDVVFAAFAVEDGEGRRVDSNGRALWELLVHEGSVPTYQALVQRHNDLVGRNWDLAFETARRAVELYPNLPGAWVLLSTMERQLGELDAISLKAHRAEFDRLARQPILRRDASGDHLGAMYWYALGGMGDSGAAAPWRDRLLAETPNHPYAVDLRALEIVEKFGTQPGQAAGRLNELWRASGANTRTVAQNGLRMALAQGDSIAIERWIDRVLRADPLEIGLVEEFVAAGQHPELGISRLQGYAARLERSEPSARALDRSVEEQRRFDLRERRALSALLGKALVEVGRREEAARYLRDAVATGWDVETFAAVADVRLTLGDTAQAVELWAMASVDPSTDAAVADSLSLLGVGVVGWEVWRTTVDAAREALVERVMATAEPRTRLTSALLVADSRGASQPLLELLGDRVALLAFWSHSPGAVQDTEALATLARQVTATGGRVVVILHESVEVGAAAPEMMPQTPLHYDVQGRVARALNVQGTPTYFVLDGAGRVWFPRSPLGEVLPQVAALRAIEQRRSAGRPTVADASQ